MPEVRVALNESPGELIFDPNAFPSLTVKVVPAGMTTGCGGAGTGATAGAAAVVGAGAGVAGLFEEFVAFPASVFDGVVFAGAPMLLAEFEAELEVVSAGLCEQATSANSRRIESTHSPRERIMFSSESEFVEAKNCNRSRPKCANEECKYGRLKRGTDRGSGTG
jgi:hypothetical protein